jgi:hypothetical protein
MPTLCYDDSATPSRMEALDVYFGGHVQISQKHGCGVGIGVIDRSMSHNHPATKVWLKRKILSKL